jgi:hypothetical protein
METKNYPLILNGKVQMMTPLLSLKAVRGDKLTIIEQRTY